MADDQTTQASVDNQYVFGDPRKRFPVIAPPKQHQEEPGLQSEMTPVPNMGEDYYVGSGRLKGRKALVVGGDSGIGGAVAIAYAREGADVVISYLPSEQSDADHVLKQIESAGVKGYGIAVDLTKASACQQLVDDALKALNGLDTIAVVAGRQIISDGITDLPDEQFVETFELNVFAAYRIIKAAVPHLPSGSTIVTTASLETWQPAPERIDYAATKGAINTFSKGLAQDLIKKGIRVNTVAPGPTWSVLQVTDGFSQDGIPTYGQDAPIGRSGQPAEIAPAYVFLSSAESSFVVGATLAVTGGMPTP